MAVDAPWPSSLIAGNPRILQVNFAEFKFLTLWRRLRYGLVSGLLAISSLVLLTA